MTNHRVLSAALVSWLSLVPSFAHHAAGAMFDLSKGITIKGTITNVDLRNPHASLSMDVRDAGGKVATWQIELTSAVNLAKVGFDSSRIDLSQTYSIDVFPAKNGSNQALGVTLRFPDGTSVDVSDKPAGK